MSASARAADRVEVMVVDGSAVVRRAMTAILTRVPGFTVSTAATTRIALAKMRHVVPDVLVMDVGLASSEGVDPVRELTGARRIPIVVCSSGEKDEVAAALRALQIGAVEVVLRPATGVQDFLHGSALRLVEAVTAAAESGRRRASRSAPGQSVPRAAEPAPTMPVNLRARTHVVAVGASTGGTEALRRILAPLPASTPPIVVVQHMPAGFTTAFARALDDACSVQVKEAADGDLLAPGKVLIAPGDRHLVLRRRSAGGLEVGVVDGPLVSRHRPSVDELFRSVAEHAGATAMGILLTGMGDDGADGLLAMRRVGAWTIAQDEASCVVYGMPKEAVTRGAVSRVLALDAIPHAIVGHRVDATQPVDATGRPGPAGRVSGV